MDYKCNICDKSYKSYQTLWTHKKKFHVIPSTDSLIVNQNNEIKNIEVPNTEIQSIEETNKYECNICGKKYKFCQGRWKHQQKCKLVDPKNVSELKIEIDELKKEVSKLKSTGGKIIKNYNNGTFINGNVVTGTTNTNKLIINKAGTENILELNDLEVTDIFNKEIEGVIKLIELLNFNERLPANHSFCTTALDSPYLSTYNSETNTIDKDRKKYFFDDIFSKAIERQEILYKNNKNNFESKKRKQIEENIEYLKKIRNSGFNNKIMKEFMKKLNLLTYNKRILVQKTWLNDQENSDDDDYFSELMNEDSNAILEDIIKSDKTKNLVLKDSESDSDSSESNFNILNKYSKKTKHKKNDLEI